MESITPIRVRYAETDQMGIVHHAVYPIWFEAGRGDYIRNRGMGYDEIEKAGFMLPLHDLTCTYVRPCRYEEMLSVHTKIIKVTGATLVFSYAVYAESEETPRVTGTTTHAWVRADNFQMVNLKRAAPELYRMLEESWEEDRG